MHEPHLTPLQFILIRYGERIRAWSPYAAATTQAPVIAPKQDIEEKAQA